jgi:hypothetical protein
MGDVANIDTGEPHRRSGAESFGVIEITLQSNVRSEEPGCPRHEEQEKSEGQAGGDDGDPNAQLRPLKLLLARQTISS